MSRAGAQPARGHPWLVPVGALRRRPGARRDVEVAAPIEELAVSNSWVPEGTKVRLAGVIESAIGGVMVTARVQAPFEGTCRRCLETARGEMEIALRELCADEPDPDLGYPVGPEWLDLEPIVRDACILELPLAPLCREDCQGLCPECGANWNRETCPCEAPPDPRWLALSGLGSGGAGEQDEPADRSIGNGGRPRDTSE
jgi:uncharacterized protein